MLCHNGVYNFYELLKSATSRYTPYIQDINNKNIVLKINYCVNTPREFTSNDFKSILQDIKVDPRWESLQCGKKYLFKFVSSECIEEYNMFIVQALIINKLHHLNILQNIQVVKELEQFNNLTYSRYKEGSLYKNKDYLFYENSPHTLNLDLEINKNINLTNDELTKLSEIFLYKMNDICKYENFKFMAEIKKVNDVYKLTMTCHPFL